MVFKFYPPSDYNIAALNEGYFWFSRKELLNDQKDLCFDLIRDSLFFKNLNENYKLDSSQNYFDKLSVCCFTKRLDNYRMWDEYAENGQGFALIVDDDLFFRFNELEPAVRFSYYPVTYINDIAMFNDESHHYYTNSIQGDMCQDIEFNYNDIILKKSDSRFVDSIFNYLFTLKDKYYSFEDENRLLLGLDVYRKRNLKNIKMIDSKGFKVMLPFGLIRGVVMGANASGLLHEQLKKITNRMRLPLYQYRSDVVLV